MVTFRAVVTGGKGEAAAFTQLEWVRRQFQRQFGFDPYPGTLNLAAEPDVVAQAALQSRAGTVIETESGDFCAAKALRVRINDRFPAVWIIPNVAGYPEEQIELMAVQSLREALHLKNGDALSIQVID